MIAPQAYEFAVAAHEGQMYGDLPYSAHLADVVDVLSAYTASDELIAAAWLHDVIEDTKVTRAEIEGAFGRFVSSVVWACTGEGYNRTSRNRSIYTKIGLFPSAAIVKVADRIANVEHSKPGSKHRKIYQAEQAEFSKYVGRYVAPSMLHRLEIALERGE